MEQKILYGIDLDKEVTPLMVRDAISQCFFEAHCQDTGLNMSNKEEADKNKMYCQQIVKKSFEDTGGDFEHPTKENIMGALSKLKDFSKNFRDQSIVQKHFDEIMVLISKLN